MMAVAAAQKNREMFAIKKSYSIEVSSLNSVKGRKRCITIVDIFRKINEYRNLINFEGEGGRKLLTINEFSILTSRGEKSENRNILEKVLGIECQSVARKARELCRTFEPPRFSRVTLYFIHLSVSLSLFSVLYLLASYTETFER